MALTLYEFSSMRRISPILFLLVCLLVGCKSSTTDTTSPYAEITAFTFVSDTANLGLTDATYKVEQRSDTGYIYNKDSLAYGTILDSVIPSITYKATPASVTFVLPDTTVVATGSDTLNFSKGPIYIYVKSSDLTAEKWYQVALTVHQVDPDLYTWTLVNPQIFTRTCDMKVFWLNNQLVLFTNDGLSTEVYTSTDGVAWQRSAAVTGLPPACRVRDILQWDSTLYYANEDYLYTTNNITTWTSEDYSNKTYSLVNMLVAYDNTVWCILRDRTTDQLILGYKQQDEGIIPTDSIYGLQGNILPADFPVSDFAALSFGASSERPRATIIGGRTDNGTALNTRWNLEFEASAGYRMKDFSIEQPDFKSLTGISVIQYDDHLVMFGGIDNDSEWRTSMLFSDDEGMNWYTPDTAHNKLPDTYGQRQKQTVAIDDKNNIYLIGGQSFTQTFSDVYRGYLMSINW